MICEAKYNPVKDLKEVDQFGYVNLIECLSNGEVPTQMSNNVEDGYNDIEDPASIIGKPSDVFEAYSMNDYIKSVGVVKDEE